MSEKILDAPSQEIEAVMEYGAATIKTIKNKYSAADLELLEERGLLLKSIREWEKGYGVYKWLATTLAIASGVFGWVFAENIINSINSLGCSTRCHGAIIAILITLAGYNMANVGRIILFVGGEKFKSSKDKELNDKASKEALKPKYNEKELIKLTRDVLKKEGEMSTTNILNVLKIEMSAREMGLLLKTAGFKQKKRHAGRVWDVEENKEADSNTETDKIRPL